MASLSVDELLSDKRFRDKELTIVGVTDFHIIEEPYYFKVIFEYTEDNGMKYNPVAEVVPEQLHFKYKIGSKFLNQKQIGYDDNVTVASFEINTYNVLTKMKIRDVVNDRDIAIVSSDMINKYFLDQNCYFIAYDEYDIIIPHYAISNHFHFKSSSLKNAILRDGLDSLYYEDTFKRSLSNPDKVKLKIKSRTNRSDLGTICNFLLDSHSKSTFESYYYQKSQCNNVRGMCKIEASFPIQNTIFNIKTLTKQINTEGRTKYLILGIYQDDYKYDFNEIDYKVDKSKLNRKVSVPKQPFVKFKPSVISGKVVNRTPSAKYIIDKSILIENDFGNNINDLTLNPIIIGVESNNPLIIQKVDKQVDGSFEPAQNNGDENIQQTELANMESIEPKEEQLFNFNKFEVLIENLANTNKVDKMILFDPLTLEAKKNRYNRVPSKYYTNKPILRRYLHGYFIYKNLKIGFVELEVSSNWKKITTWFFIFDNLDDDFNEKFISQVLYNYLCIDKKLEEIEKELYYKSNIKFFRKKHPDVSLNEISVQNWVKDVLKSIN